MINSDQRVININQSLASALTPTHFELIILPTEQCNFRCSYCYEDFQIGKMQDSTVAAIKTLISHRVADLRSFQLSWFGGEPLLAKDIVLDISAHAKAECEKHGVNFLQGCVTTNGYALNSALLKQLAAVNQSCFQISLDGYGEAHDATRKLISEKGTFERIWSNLIELHRSDLDFSTLLRLHLRPDNLESIELLVDEINKTLLPDPRFAVVFKPVSNFRGPGCSDIDTLEHQYAQAMVSKLQQRVNGEFLDVENNDFFHICYAAKPNSLLIRANGNIGKCTVALNDDRNNIGRINDDGTLEIDSAAMLPWLRGFKPVDPKALSCPMHGMPEHTIHFQPKHSVALAV